MTGIDSFSLDYGQARTKFRASCIKMGGTLDELRHPEAGPDGAALFVDVARFGNAEADRVLVLISGTHGVEGFCGSGAQIDLVRRSEIAELPTDIGVLMIHAINPYGFAWLRRTTHENIDLNRNWIDFALPLPGNDGYGELHPFLCPQTWSRETRKAGEEKLRQFAIKHGAIATKNALGGGQYQFADGLYYGGKAPSWSRTAQTMIFEHYLTRASHVAIIDYHTGLGPFGFAEQVLTVPSSEPAFARAESWYGAVVKSTVDGDSVGAHIGGDGLSAAAGILPQAQVTALALEVGTLDRTFVVSANRADNWLHAYGDAGAASAGPIKRAIRDAYFCDRADWKGMVLGQSLLAFRQTIAGLRRASA